MGSEYFINSQELEDKVRTLLPSQGGAGAGFDLSASTQIVPIIDLTESAEGSNVRQDLQTALSLTTASAFDINGTTTTIINNTGYFRVTATYVVKADASTVQSIAINMTDGTTTKKVYGTRTTTGGNMVLIDFDKVFFVQAGESINVVCSAQALFTGSSRQIADIDGNLINP